MKKSRWLAFLAVLPVLFVFSACTEKAPDEGSETEKKVTVIEYPDQQEKVAAAEEYLLANGYSEAFVAAAGAQTKLYLQEKNAVFERDGSIEYKGTGGEPVITEGTVTISDISDEAKGYAAKIVTVNWSWDNADVSEADFITFSWAKPLDIQMNETLYELHGTGNLQSDGEFPQQANGTFLAKEGNESAYIGFTDACEIAFALKADEGCMLRKFYTESSFGDYLIGTQTIGASFSVELAKFGAENESGSVSVSHSTLREGVYRQNSVGACSFQFYPQG